MEINSFSVIMAIILFTVVCTTCSLFLYRTKSQHLWIIGFALVLCVLRCLIPVEFAGTPNLNIWTIYPEFFSFLEKTVFRSMTVSKLICIIWVLVCSLLFIKQIYALNRQFRFNRLVRSQKTDIRILRIASRAADVIHCSAEVNVYVTNSISSPIMTGLFHPIVLIPGSTAEMTDLEIEYILRHEIAHYKGGDSWYKLAIQVLACLLWWNPAVYLLRRSVSQLLELRCDSRACNSLDAKEKSDYSAVLLKIIRNTLDAPKKLVASGFIGAFDSLYVEQRIKHLMNKSTSKKSPLVTALVACICVLLYFGSYSFIVQPAYAPPEMEDNTTITTITPENAWLIPIEDEQYEVWVDGAYYMTISSDSVSLPFFSQLPIREKEN